MDAPGSHEPHLDPLLTGIEKMNDDQRLALYEAEHRWAEHYNGNIWSTLQLLLPLALAGLTLYDEISWVAYAFTGAASAILLIFWAAVADGHRKLWKERFAVTSRIEIVWGVREQGSNLDAPLGRGTVPARRWPPKIYVVRRILVTTAILLWIVSATVKGLNDRDSQSAPGGRYSHR